MEQPLWRPSAERCEQTRLKQFIAQVERDWGVACADYAALHRFSVEQIDRFWSSVWRFCGVIGEWDGAVVVDEAEQMLGARFFPTARLNYAENLLAPGDASADAIVFWGEDQLRRRLSRGELRSQVSQLVRYFDALGLQRGDRVAGFLPNLPETVIAMLACAARGLIWSSCSPDFGVQGVLDRFGQIEPKLLICADGYIYKGKRHDSLVRVAELLERLPSVEQTLVVPYTESAPSLARLNRAVLFPEALSQHPAGPIAFERLPFDTPLYILYSSGTTGQPKCIVHGAGGTLLQHLKEHQLQCDIRPGDRVFYFTTCGWMMWNWLASALASEATLLLYDGSPFALDGRILFDYADAERMTLFGTSAKYIDALAKEGLSPRETHDLGTIRTLTSTGSPLAPEAFDYVYRQVKSDICLSSISGGTDIIGCFVGGNPLGPVWRGEIQAPCLGMAVDVVDSQGAPLRGTQGELTCSRPFPSMPLGFFGDPAGKRYRAAYFERFPGIWCHGDWAELTENGGLVIHGRSDATLNPGGVRIGTAEIYRQVEQVAEVQEALAVGQRWGDDERIILFVKLRSGCELDEPLKARIKQQIRRGASPRHVPAKVLRVDDIPRTRSGKIVELAVRELIHGRPVTHVEALANPEALEHYRQLVLD
jgi:acetoacetyl-CoA synthetase